MATEPNLNSNTKWKCFYKVADRSMSAVTRAAGMLDGGEAIVMIILGVLRRIMRRRRTVAAPKKAKPDS